MKQIINDFINSIDTKLYSRIRASKSDAECRRYLKEHLQKQLTIHSVVGRSEQLVCSDCKLPFTKEELQIKEHCFNCGWEFAN